MTHDSKGATNDYHPDYRYCLCIDHVDPPLVASSLCPVHGEDGAFLEWAMERNDERHRLYDEIERLRDDSLAMSRLREAIQDALRHGCTQMRELLTEALR